MKRFLSFITLKNNLKRVIPVLCVFVLFLQSTAIANNVSGAGCLIKLDEGLVMVKDAWSGKYSIPGGGLKSGEETKHCAIRETLEETGIKVEIDADLQQHNDFHIFLCSPTEEVNALKNCTTQSKYIIGNIPLRVMSRNEIQSVSLIDPTLLPVPMWRFPLSRESIVTLFNDTPPGQNVILRENKLNDINHFFRLETELISTLQAYNHRSIVILNRLFSFFAEKYLFLIIISFLIFSGRFQLGFFLLFSIFGASLATGILKDLFELERPFEAIPKLQLADASSFGFPSGHTMTATVFWGLLYFIFKSTPIRMVFLVIIVLVSFSRIYLGVHYPHDVFGGWLFGSLMVLILSQYIRNDGVNTIFNNLKKIWIYGTVLTVSGVALHYTPSTLFMGITWFGTMTGLQLGKEQRQTYNIPTNLNAKFFRSVVGAGGLIIIVLLCGYVLPDEKTVPLITLKIGISSILTGLWISWGGFVVFNSLKRADKTGENRQITDR